MFDRTNSADVDKRSASEPNRSGEARPDLRSRGAKWKFAAVGGMVLVVSVAAVWWTMQRAAPVMYITAPVTRGAIERTTTATGTVNPELTIIIGSYVSGVISSMSCDYNTRVRQGQVCATIDPRPYQAALDQAKGQLARDEAQLRGARVDLERYKASLARNAIAQQTYDDQLALVQQLQGAVQFDQGAVETASVNLGYTHIISPVNGTVVARNITIGQTVAASFQTPTLFLIATDLTKMEVDTNVSESDIGAVKEGNSARFTVEAYTDRQFRGSVVQVRQAPQTVQNVVTYDVVVGVSNPQFLLKPGMTATVAIVTDSRANVLRIPDQALRYQPAGLPARLPAASQAGAPQPSDAHGAAASYRVWVSRNGKPAAVDIRTGLDDETYSEILSGDLRLSDQVIIGEQRGGSVPRPGAFRFGL